MRRGLIGAAFLMILGVFAVALPTSAASSFADPAFQQQWQQGEAITPNFWGPLANAKDGQQESYKEAAGGKRLVQYFDKARMELTNGKLTNGLLTVELKTGRLQTGDASFEQRQPAKINIAGDAGSDGPTYADLAQLPEKQANADPAAYPYVYANGAFTKPKSEADFPFDIFRVPGGNAGGTDYASDPGGRYGNIILPLFRQLVPDFASLCGLPITPIFFAQVKIAGMPRWVLVQAFERRVLTYNPANDPAFRVEFGNIGQNYYQWRYGSGSSQSPPSPVSPPATTPVSPPATTGDAIGQTLNCKCSYSGKSTFSVTVNDVKRSATIGKATASGIYVEFFVHVTNTGKEPGYISDSGLVVLDSQGRKFSTSGASSAQSAAQDQYHLKGFYDDVQPSLSADMVFVFDIAPDATGLHFALGQSG